MSHNSIIFVYCKIMSHNRHLYFFIVKSRLITAFVSIYNDNVRANLVSVFPNCGDGEIWVKQLQWKLIGCWGSCDFVTEITVAGGYETNQFHCIRNCLLSLYPPVKTLTICSLVLKVLFNILKIYCMKSDISHN
jgi:hypothetical protein